MPGSHQDASADAKQESRNLICYLSTTLLDPHSEEWKKLREALFLHMAHAKEQAAQGDPDPSLEPEISCSYQPMKVSGLSYNGSTPQRFKEYFERLDFLGKKKLAEIIIRCSPHFSDSINPQLLYPALAQLEDKTVAREKEIYLELKYYCAWLSDPLLKQNLSDLIDILYGIWSKSTNASNKKSIEDLLGYLSGSMRHYFAGASSVKEREELEKTFITQLNNIKNHKCFKALIKQHNHHDTSPALSYFNKHFSVSIGKVVKGKEGHNSIWFPPKYRPQTPEEQSRPDVFYSLLSISGKEGGAKPGGVFKFLGRDGIIRTFVIKRGEGLEDTLAEYFAYLEVSAYKGRQYAHSAITHLVPKISDYETEKKDHKLSREDEIFVASEYHRSDYTIDAYKLAGHKERPKFAGSLHAGSIKFFHDLNAECGLGFEEALYDAIKLCDYDFHFGNIQFVCDLGDVKPEHYQTAYNTLTTLQAVINGLTERDRENKKTTIVDKIKRLKSLGADVFLQKIDHGFAYYDYDTRECSLKNHREINPINPFGGNFRKPTNHIAEFTQFSDKLFTDRFCEIIIRDSIHVQIVALKRAFRHFKKQLRSQTDGDESYIILLAAFCKHINPRFSRVTIKDLRKLKRKRVDIISSLEKRIFSGLVKNRKRLIAAQNDYYLGELQKIKQLTPLQHQLKETLEKRLSIKKRLVEQTQVAEEKAPVSSSQATLPTQPQPGRAQELEDDEDDDEDEVKEVESTRRVREEEQNEQVMTNSSALTQNSLFSRPPQTPREEPNPIKNFESQINDWQKQICQSVVQSMRGIKKDAVSNSTMPGHQSYLMEQGAISNGAHYIQQPIGQTGQHSSVVYRLPTDSSARSFIDLAYKQIQSLLADAPDMALRIKASSSADLVKAYRAVCHVNGLVVDHDENVSVVVDGSWLSEAKKYPPIVGGLRIPNFEMEAKGQHAKRHVYNQLIQKGHELKSLCQKVSNAERFEASQASLNEQMAALRNQSSKLLSGTDTDLHEAHRASLQHIDNMRKTLSMTESSLEGPRGRRIVA